MRKAANVSIAAHRRAMSACHPGVNECQIEAELIYEFRRAGTVAPEGPRTVDTGYFVVVPSGESDRTPEWHARTHMTVHGQARDHGTLSRFVRSLFERREVRDVRLQRSALRRYTAASVVDFELAVVLDTGRGGG